MIPRCRYLNQLVFSCFEHYWLWSVNDCRFQRRLVGVGCANVWDARREIAFWHRWSDRQSGSEHWRLFIPRYEKPPQLALFEPVLQFSRRTWLCAQSWETKLEALSFVSVILEKTIRIPRSLSVKAASVLKGFLNKVNNCKPAKTSDSIWCDGQLCVLTIRRGILLFY